MTIIYCDFCGVRLDSKVDIRQGLRLDPIHISAPMMYGQPDGYEYEWAQTDFDLCRSCHRDLSLKVAQSAATGRVKAGR